MLKRGRYYSFIISPVLAGGAVEGIQRCRLPRTWPAERKPVVLTAGIQVGLQPHRVQDDVSTLQPPTLLIFIPPTGCLAHELL